MSSSVGLVFDCCLYCSLLLRCRLMPGYIHNSAFYPLNPQKISAFRLRISPVVTSAHPYTRTSAFHHWLKQSSLCAPLQIWCLFSRTSSIE